MDLIWVGVRGVDLVCYCVLRVFKFDYVFGSGLCSYVLGLRFKSVVMFLCVLVQNELDLNLCILLFLIFFFLFS